MTLHFNPQSVAAIAKLCLGDPNHSLSTNDDLRFGNNGSVCVALSKATYFDYEASAGGGMLDLISKKRGLSRRDAIEWLRKEGINIADNESSNGETEQKSRAFFVEGFDYVDEAGVLLFQVVRQEFRLPCGKVELSDSGKPKKTFKQRRPDPDHPRKWIWKTRGVRKVLYRLPQLLDAVAEGRTVFIVEGERKVDLLRGWGLSATCSPGGGGVGKPGGGAGKKWLDAYSIILSNAADIIILPDADKTGEEYRDLGKGWRPSSHPRPAWPRTEGRCRGLGCCWGKRRDDDGSRRDRRAAMGSIK